VTRGPGRRLAATDHPRAAAPHGRAGRPVRPRPALPGERGPVRL